jgi:hypothetical protein
LEVLAEAAVDLVAAMERTQEEVEEQAVMAAESFIYSLKL